MNEGKNWLEWTVFGVGLLLTVGTLVYLGHQAWRTPTTSPQLAAVLGPPQRSGEGVKIPVTVTNTGGQTAENVEITVARMEGAREVAHATCTLAFVPKGTRRQGYVVFPTDLSDTGTFVVQSIGYRLP